ncbi:hypothetical protein M427DRAFT_55404 [Gonapodya prolifera JEL478]|uniref:Uncharacterized protein n=1 Tax=Gonapodya prolifera (strain JEL478) TaxID=1344416 RepID=A0A139AJ72_GONPJ|nr:hypothetical protein M427DRAFT_55404 [Gonapodya prolifera JEL478]|eukprot:KXS16445.1 hypothetical protein M427DRAFT_55404 [Gonapodya prolifera JEL478]
MERVCKGFDHSNNVYQTRRETLERCEEDSTRGFVLDLEKLAVERGVALPWLRRW